MKLEVLQNINDGCITKEIRNHVITPIYLYQLSPLEIEFTSEKIPHGKLLLSFVGSYLPSSMEAGIDINQKNVDRISKAQLTREDLAVVHLITNALNIAKEKENQGEHKMTVNNEELEQPTIKEEPKEKASAKKVSSNKVSYEFPKEFYDANHEVMEAYLTKKPIKHTGKESKNKKTPGAGILTIPASDQKRFQTVMNLKKIKTKDYLKK